MFNNINKHAINSDLLVCLWNNKHFFLNEIKKKGRGKKKAASSVSILANSIQNISTCKEYI